MKLARWILCGALVASALATNDARAVLTASEQDQVKQAVVSGHVAGAARVRSLVARPDLTPEESAAALSAPFASVPFTELRAAFVKELLFGGASAASRPVLTVAATRALFARADAVLGKNLGDLASHADAVTELL